MRGAGAGREDHRIRVVVADDHHRYRAGLRAVLGLASDVVVVGEAGDGDEAVETCRGLDPDVVLLDVRMPGSGGVDACRRIRRVRASVRVLMLTASDDEEDLFAAVRAGAHGYVLKDVPAEELIGAVRRVRRGEAVIPPRLASVLLEEFGRLARGQPGTPPGDDGTARLTERETEVLRLVAQGLGNRHIATHLVLSENTVKNHVSHILEKLHLTSRTEAAVYAHRRRIMPPEA